MPNCVRKPKSPSKSRSTRHIEILISKLPNISIPWNLYPQTPQNLYPRTTSKKISPPTRKSLCPLPLQISTPKPTKISIPKPHRNLDTQTLSNPLSPKPPTSLCPNHSVQDMHKTSKYNCAEITKSRMDKRGKCRTIKNDLQGGAKTKEEEAHYTCLSNH